MEQRIDVGATLSRVFTLYREQPGILLPAAALLYLLRRIATIALGSGAAGLGLVATLLALVVQYWYQGVVVRAVVDMEDGRRDFSMGDLSAPPRRSSGRCSWPACWPASASRSA